MQETEPKDSQESLAEAIDPNPDNEAEKPTTSREVGGRKGPDPTRYGDWEKDGRCIDF